MIIYEKYNEDDTVLINTIKDPDALKLSKMKGYRPLVNPVLTRFQRKGDKVFLEHNIVFGVVDLADADIVSIIKNRVIGLYEIKKEQITETRKFRRAVTRAIDLLYKGAKYHWYVLGSDLTQEEKLEMQYLGELAGRSYALWGAEDDIILEVEAMDTATLRALPADWEETNPAWTE